MSGVCPFHLKLLTRQGWIKVSPVESDIYNLETKPAALVQFLCVPYDQALFGISTVNTSELVEQIQRPF